MKQETVFHQGLTFISPASLLKKTEWYTASLHREVNQKPVAESMSPCKAKTQNPALARSHLQQGWFWEVKTSIMSLSFRCSAGMKALVGFKCTIRSMPCVADINYPSVCRKNRLCLHAWSIIMLNCFIKLWLTSFSLRRNSSYGYI